MNAGCYRIRGEMWCRRQLWLMVWYLWILDVTDCAEDAVLDIFNASERIKELAGTHVDRHGVYREVTPCEVLSRKKRI